MTTTTIREALSHLYTAYALLSDLEDAKNQEANRTQKEMAFEIERLTYETDFEIITDIENHLYSLEVDTDNAREDEALCSMACETLSNLIKEIVKKA